MSVKKIKYIARIHVDNGLYFVINSAWGKPYVFLCAHSSWLRNDSHRDDNGVYQNVYRRLVTVDFTRYSNLIIEYWDGEIYLED